MRTLLLSAALLMSAPAFANGKDAEASDPAVAKTARPAAPEETKSKKICKRIESTESRLDAKKLCMTQQQWREYERGF